MNKPKKLVRPVCNTCMRAGIAASAYWDMKKQQWIKPTKKQDEGYCSHCNSHVDFTMRAVGYDFLTPARPQYQERRMANITKEFAEEIYRSGMEGVKVSLTANELAQLAWAWLELQVARSEVQRLMRDEHRPQLDP